jgi:hypothetical protein
MNTDSHQGQSAQDRIADRRDLESLLLVARTLISRLPQREILSLRVPHPTRIEFHIGARPLRLLHTPHCQLAELEPQISPRRLTLHHACHCCVAPVCPADLQPVARHSQHAARRTVAFHRLAALAVGPTFLESSSRHGGSPRSVSGFRWIRVGHARASTIETTRLSQREGDRHVRFAMCGRLRVGKDFLHVISIGRCSHVFGL